LGIGRFHAVLVHDWEMLSEESCESVVRGLGEAHSAGLVDRVGVSIYSEAGVESARQVFSALGVPLGALQVPANPLDRRLDDSPLLMELHAAGAQIVVRSAFLQGVLLAESGRWADHVDVRRFRTQVVEQGGTAVSACLGHVKALPWATHVVVGVTTAAELSEICEVWDECEPELLPASLASSDVELIDPRQW
jgi:aryl-alcohol dehydrogenase-like predicted oxidoreductase